MLNLDNLINRKALLEKEIYNLSKLISGSPKGSLISRKKNGKYYFSYMSETAAGKSEEVYIPCSNSDLASQIALRSYAEKRLEDCKKELNILTSYQRFCAKEGKADHYLKTHPGIAQLVLPGLQTDDEYARKWQEATYYRSNSYPEHLRYPTIVPDLKVRSKSESAIVSRLVFFKVPFRYEEQIIINGRAFHPDFTCLKVKSRKIYYWEHQGAWDRTEYVESLTSREVLFSSAGLIPWKNLIITTETANDPLDINWVDEIIQYFLL